MYYEAQKPPPARATQRVIVTKQIHQPKRGLFDIVFMQHSNLVLCQHCRQRGYRDCTEQPNLVQLFILC